MDTKGLQNAMEARARMYGMLSRVYLKEVDGEFLDELKSMRFPQNTGNEVADAAYLRLYEYLRKTPESVLDDLAVDYARAFIGSGSLDAHAAYPYESVYTSSTGLTMQEARDDVLAIYRANALDKSPHWRESEDHAALELLFLKILSERTRHALANGDDRQAKNLLETQKNFLNDHVLNWMGMLVQDVPLYVKHDFYQAFATWEFVNEDHAFLNEATAHSTLQED